MTGSISPDSLLSEVLPKKLALRTGASLAGLDVVTAEDLYNCIANLGGNWFKGFQGVKREDAVELVHWLKEHEDALGEVTSIFYPPGMAPADEEAAAQACGAFSLSVPAPVLTQMAGCGIALPAELSGQFGTNRSTGNNSLEVDDDLSAVRLWLNARAGNPNTLSQYRKESERFILWAAMERGKAMSSLTAADAALYPTWLEQLGRTEPEVWARTWKLPQSVWLGSRNAARLSETWKPFNGPLSHSSRKTSLTVIRLLFAFLVKTGYLRSNPFDQISSKVRYLPGEGAPKAFADRSLSPSQWEEVMKHLESLPSDAKKTRLRVILSLGKGLGMRASEIIRAKAGWIAVRRIGDEDLSVIEIVGKGDKIRRLPLSDETLEAINNDFMLRGLPEVMKADPETPIVANLRGESAAAGISRSGLHRTLTAFFEEAANKAQERSAADAAKLRAGSAHWLRHTFATSALKAMDINIVQNAMGHASIGTTSRYLTPEEAQIAAAMKKMKPL